MRKAWFKNLQLLVLIFLFLSISSLGSLSAEAGETEAASLQLVLTLTPAEAVVPGDRITRQILLENLTDKKLKYSVEEIHCTGTAALLPYLTLELVSGEQSLFSGRADQLGTMSSFPISIPGVHENGSTGGAVRAEAAGEVRLAEGVPSAEAAGAATVLKLTLDFSPEAEASLMGSEAEIQLLLSAAETEEASAEDEEASTEAADDAVTETGIGAEVLIEETVTDAADVRDVSDAAENAQAKSSEAEQGKESVEADGSAAHAESNRGVLFGEAVSFLGGPGADDVLEAVEDPLISADNTQQSGNQQRESAEIKTVNSDTGTKAMDSRLAALLKRLHRQQKGMSGEAETTASAEMMAEASDNGSLSIMVEELGSQGLCIQKAQSIYGGEAVTIYLGEANMKRSIRHIFSALGNLLLWLMIFCAVYFALSAYQERRTGKPFFFMGYKPVLILSESMEPTYPKGAIVLVRKQKREAEPGDVVMFSPEAGSGTYVIHRIVEESEEGFITRGDHNNTEDRGIVAPEQIYGTVKGLIWA